MLRELQDYKMFLKPRTLKDSKLWRLDLKNLNYVIDILTLILN